MKDNKRKIVKGLTSKAILILHHYNKMKMKNLKLLVILGAICIAPNAFLGQDANHITIISEAIDQVTVEFNANEDDEKTSIDNVLGMYSSMSAVQKVIKLDNNHAQVFYYKAKLNGPGIFIGLAKEASFSEVKLIDKKK